MEQGTNYTTELVETDVAALMLSLKVGLATELIRGKGPSLTLSTKSADEISAFVNRVVDAFLPEDEADESSP